MKYPLDLTYRPARTTEAPGIAVMSRDLIETGLVWRYRPARIVEMIRDPEVVALVACNHASDLYGLAVMQFAQDTAHLALLCVQPAQQRLGIATRLLDWLLESASVAGIVSVHLELRADNRQALAFYRRMAFEPTSKIDDYYGPGLTACRMERVLRTCIG